MENKPSDIALSLYEIAVPVFISLKEEMNPKQANTRSRLNASEITFTQLRVLLAIEYGRDQVGKLARNAHVAQPAMSKIVDYLIGRGLVQRKSHPTDRRQIKLSLTASGSAITRQVRRQAAERYVAAISQLSTKKLNKLIDGIAVMLSVIESTRKENV